MNVVHESPHRGGLKHGPRNQMDSWSRRPRGPTNSHRPVVKSWTFSSSWAPHLLMGMTPVSELLGTKCDDATMPAGRFTE